MTTRRWFYLIPRTGDAARAGARHRADTRSTPARAQDPRTRAARRWRRGSTTLLRGSGTRGDGILARRTPSRTSRASMPARWSPIRKRGVDVVSSGDLVQRFERAVDAAAARDAPGRLRRRSTGSRIAPSRPSREQSGRARRSPSTTSSSSMVGWFQEEGLIADDAAGRGGDGERRQPALPAGGRAAAGRSAATSWCCSICGASCQRPGAVYADITWVGFTGAQVPDEFAARVRRHCRAPATRRSTLVTQTPRARAPTFAAGRSTARRATVLQSMRATARTSCIARATASARTCTATACTWTTTRRTTTGACSPGTGFTIEPGVYFPHFGVRTEDQRVRTTPARRA